MNNKLAWFAVKTNIAAFILMMVLYFIVGYFFLDLMKDVWIGGIIGLIIVTVGFYLALKIMTKNSNLTVAEKIVGIQYAWYAFMVFNIISLIYNSQSQYQALSVIFTIISIVFAYGATALVKKDKKVLGS